MHELLVFDQLTPCPYLAGETARMPLRRPVRLSRQDFDQRLAEGDRRLGRFLYRPQCPDCRACQPIRVSVAQFQPARTLRRTLRSGDAQLVVRVGPPACDKLRVRLFNRHKQQRGLSHGEEPIDQSGYYDFLVETCAETLEFSYWLEGELVAVAVSDRGHKALSAVYCYFEPTLERLSLGTYNVLKQIEACRGWGLDYLYLGYYIAASGPMRYKARFLPHERLIEGKWRRFER